MWMCFASFFSLHISTSAQYLQPQQSRLRVPVRFEGMMPRSRIRINFKNQCEWVDVYHNVLLQFCTECKFWNGDFADEFWKVIFERDTEAEFWRKYKEMVIISFPFDTLLLYCRAMMYVVQ